MLGFIVKRLFYLIATLFVIIIIIFGAMKLVPGDPAQLLAGELAPPEQIKAIRHDLGLDRPVILQYMDYMAHLVRGDMGISYRTRRPVVVEIAARYPHTVELAGVSILIATLIGVIAGVVSATRRGSVFDAASRLLALIGVTMPSFWLGILLILLFSVSLRLLPSTYSPGIRGILLPAFTLGLNGTAFIARMTRSCMLDVINQDYIVTARAKGLSEWLVIYKHGLRNALIAVVTIVGLQMGSLLGGAIIVESVFSWPGIGLLLIDSVAYRDYSTVQGTVLVVAAMVVLINAIVDVLYSWLDPRIIYN